MSSHPAGSSEISYCTVSRPTIRVATDVGGTFTDLVYFETDPTTPAKRASCTAKADTTPPDFEQGVARRRSPRAALDPDEVAFLAHGTTVVINALTERKGVTNGLITTEGFRDSLEIARGNRPDFFNLTTRSRSRSCRAICAARCRAASAYKGEEREPLDLSGLPAILATSAQTASRRSRSASSTRTPNPSHEQAVARRGATSSGQAYRPSRPTRSPANGASTSAPARPCSRAYVQPPTERYLTRLSERMTGDGFSGQLYIMQSNCGVDSSSARGGSRSRWSSPARRAASGARPSSAG